MTEGNKFPTIVFNPPVYPDHTIPKGVLPKDMRAQACWFFYTIAQSAKEKAGDSIDDQVILEGELWLDTHYQQQKESVALMYGLIDPSEFDKFWEFVVLEADACGLPEVDMKYVRAGPTIQ